MRAHAGVHPCMGAVDLVPIYPLGEEVGVEDCAEEARGEKPLKTITMSLSVDGPHRRVSCSVFCAALA